MPEARTVGEMIEDLKQYPADTPIRIEQTIEREGKTDLMVWHWVGETWIYEADEQVEEMVVIRVGGDQTHIFTEDGELVCQYCEQFGKHNSHSPGCPNKR